MNALQVQLSVGRAIAHSYQVCTDIYQPHAEDKLWRVTLMRGHKVLRLVIDEAILQDHEAVEMLVLDAERKAA